MSTSPEHGRTALIAGASRGLGLAMTDEFLRRGWRTIATVRSSPKGGLRELKERSGDRLEIERLDIDKPDELTGLRDRMQSRRIDLLFVNAGTTTHDEHVQVGKVSDAEFTRVMTTNALSPMRVIDSLQHLVPAGGLIGAMSSGQGSISTNETGMREVYRSSKAALNMFMRSFAARQGDLPRASVLLAPGWIRTQLGGPNATFGVEESAPLLVEVLIAQLGGDGLRYLDRNGRDVPW